MKKFIPVIAVLSIFAAAALISYAKICKGDACPANAPSVESTSTENSTSVTPIIDNGSDFDVVDPNGASTVETGIRGQILLGPTCPVVPANDDGHCADKPYGATVNVETPDGIFVKSFTSNENGDFYVRLSPGAYVFLPISSGVYPKSKPITVNVQEGVVNTVNIYFDSGIR